MAGYFIDKYAYTLASLRQVSRTERDMTAGMGEKDKSHPVRTDLFYGANVVGIAHATYFYNHFVNMIFITY